MREVEPAHARAGPHRKRLGHFNSRIPFDIEQSPQRALLRVIGTRWVARGRPDAAVFLMDEFIDAQVFGAAVTPLPPHPCVQAFGKGLRKTIGDSLRHDGVVIVELAPEPVAQLLQADSAGYCECSDEV